MAKEQVKPRLCHLLRDESGYGFHLHGEKGKSGQYIRKVEPGSRAEAAGLRAGDRLVEVNGVNVEKETHHQVVQRIKALENETRLLVVDKDIDEYLRSLGISCTEAMAQSEDVLNANATSPQTPTSESSEVWKPQAELGDGVIQRRAHSFSSSDGKQDLNGQVKELCPRLCRLKKGPNGYGFNLHSERSKPGQYIRSVDPGSPAARAGLRPNDRLLEVNRQSVEGLKHSEVVSCIKAKENEAELLVVDSETEEYFKKLGITPTEAHVAGGFSRPITNGSAQMQLNGGSSTSSSHSDLQTPQRDRERRDAGKRDPFEESGLSLSPTAAEAREKAKRKRAKQAPPMDWSRKHEIFSNF
ncbi:Na(+)/H(+) exchange regulatory cofactor NHE-RF2 [Microcaecilia unicolor]|uniref:Na(+)/H(+) exchange regulatory cofactor NHE-RF n=1 Tax=Microcaecilia unicolor TaxID=1415580 RepID=A0A6P7YVB3_9AMPH|nr:Na(+)/H(+) exchange regulatory cofactor NHE-RF2 [Microcaecilia unicolor]